MTYEDHFVTCGQGHRHWGPAGGAGLLVSYTDDHEDTWYLLQHRGPGVQVGDTWGIPGGAIDPDESPINAAVREFQEEVDSVLPWLALETRLVQRVEDDHDGWIYTTFVLHVPGPFRARPKGETGVHGLIWVRRDDVFNLELHPGVRQLFESEVLS